MVELGAEAEAAAESQPEIESEQPPPNSGKLIIDATATPADITYPTDLKILNAAREKLEHIIDILHRPLVGQRRSRGPTGRRRAGTSWRSPS